MVAGEGEPLVRGTFVRVREVVADDAETIVEWRNRPDVARWLYQWEPLTVESHLRWFDSARRHDLLFMFEQDDGKPVGMGSLYGFQRKFGQAAEWGRICAAQDVGNPYALMEACYLVHRLAFETLQLRRTTTEVTSGNARSERLVRYLGYVLEGTRRKHHVLPSGEALDVLELGLMPEEFAQRKIAIERDLYRDRQPPTLGSDLSARLRPPISSP